MSEQPNTFDRRTRQTFGNFFKYKLPLGKIEDYYNPLVPKGHTNELLDLQLATHDGKKIIGDVEISTSGFIEIMAFSQDFLIALIERINKTNREAIIKLKRIENTVYLFIM